MEAQAGGRRGRAASWVLSPIADVGGHIPDLLQHGGKYQPQASSASLPFSTTSRFLCGSGPFHPLRELRKCTRSFGPQLPSIRVLGWGGRRGAKGASQMPNGDCEASPGRRGSRRRPGQRLPEKKDLRRVKGRKEENRIPAPILPCIPVSC